MSFDKMKPAELKDVCEQYGIEDLGQKPTKPQMLAALREEGVEYGDYVKLTEAENETIDKVEVPAQATASKWGGKDVLVKMDRKNFRFDVLGFTFTKDHPYVVMPEDAFQEVVERVEGFRLATPKEVQEFYS